LVEETSRQRQRAAENEQELTRVKRDFESLKSYVSSLISVRETLISSEKQFQTIEKLFERSVCSCFVLVILDRFVILFWHIISVFLGFEGGALCLFCCILLCLLVVFICGLRLDVNSHVVFSCHNSHELMHRITVESLSNLQ